MHDNSNSNCNHNNNNDVKFYLNDDCDNNEWNLVRNNSNSKSKLNRKASNTTRSAAIKIDVNEKLNIGNCGDAAAIGDDDPYIASVKSLIKQCTTGKVMVILRGLPGSGKTTLASKIKMNGVVLSTDNYFVNNKGQYVFDKRKLDDAHAFNKSKAKDALQQGITPVIIDNTNIRIWEFKPYIKMACEYDYEVKLIEPNTKWKSKPSELAQKNTHNVPYQKIKSMSLEFEKNVDLEKLINEFKNENQVTIETTNIPKINESTTKKIKSSGLLFGENNDFKSFLKITGSEWYIPENTTTSSSAPVITAPTTKCLSSLEMFTSTSLVSSFNNCEKVDKSIQTSIDASFNDKQLIARSRNIQPIGVIYNNSALPHRFRVLKYDRSCDTIDFDDYLLDIEVEKNFNLLKEMFADAYSDTFYKDLLKTYENDLTVVANMISEKLEFDNSLSELDKKENKLPASLSKPVFNPLRLSELCNQLLDKMNVLLERHFSLCEDIQNNDDSFESSDISDEKIEFNSSGCNLEDTSKQILNEQQTFSFKLDKSFAKSLFDRFADPNEIFDENESFDVECDLNLAFEIFKKWKKTSFNKARGLLNKTSKVPVKTIEQEEEDDYEDDIEKINERIKQIEMDAQLALDIFEHENIRDPIDGYPVYMSDYGVNAASISLRQIMAEQTAEEYLNSKKLPQSTTSNYSSDPTLATKLKRRQIYDMYSLYVDKNVLDQAFYENGYNLHETCKFIEKKFGVKNINKDAPFKIENNKQHPKSKSTSAMLPSLPAKPDTENNYRELAHEYFQLRQDYFEKATQAFSKGWGAVAQFYAEMGHKQSIYMKKSNKTASLNIFALNNADLECSNTLDLHGLQVSEAIQIFKQIYLKKKEEYFKNRTKQKKFLYLITGCGRHSKYQIARLRPRIISYLHQQNIKFQEPNLGLLRVELV